MRALTLIQLCARDANDVAYERIAKYPSLAANIHNWLDWLNDAQRTIVLVRPDAHAVTRNIGLVDGTRQSLQPGAFRLLVANRNMGFNGTTPGRALRITARDDEDAVNLDWHTETPATPVREILYDDKKNPLVYYVRPPGIVGWQIEVVLSEEPTPALPNDLADITISEVYSTAIQQWMMYRYYAIASQATINAQKATGYFNNFFALLGLKVRVEMFEGPFTVGRMPAAPPAAGAPNG